MEDRYIYFLLWSTVWIVVLNSSPGGSTAIPTAFRLNFIHGIISCTIAAGCLAGYFTEGFTTTVTLSYFIVDFFNIMLNDFVWKAKTYQSPETRRIEYCHHIFCCGVGLVSEYYFHDFCDFKSNPFVELMFAEFSTPLLIAWRWVDTNAMLGYFILAFIACRIIYHGGIFIPKCMGHCHWSVGFGFGIPYNLMNIYFLVMTTKRYLKGRKQAKKSE